MNNKEAIVMSWNEGERVVFVQNFKQNFSWEHPDLLQAGPHHIKAGAEGEIYKVFPGTIAIWVEMSYGKIFVILDLSTDADVVEHLFYPTMPWWLQAQKKLERLRFEPHPFADTEGDPLLVKGTTFEEAVRLLLEE